MLERLSDFLGPDSSSSSVHLRFQDNTSLSFQLATGLAMEAYFSRWKTRNERVLRYWPRIQTDLIFRTAWLASLSPALDPPFRRAGSEESYL